MGSSIGGVCFGTLTNCILYYNTAKSSRYPNYLATNANTLQYCCTTPLPDSGLGNIDTEPQLASFSHLSSGSPCRGAGDATTSSGMDVDGEPWLNPPSIGCDEYTAGAVTGPVTVAIATPWLNVSVGFVLDLIARIEGRVSGSVWDFGDGTVVSNRAYASHAWAALGDYPVVLTAYNESYPEGVSATVTIRVVQAVHHVSAVSAGPRFYRVGVQ